MSNADVGRGIYSGGMSNVPVDVVPDACPICAQICPRCADYVFYCKCWFDPFKDSDSWDEETPRDL